MIVVSDTSVIINLASVGLLELLPRLYGNVIIPEAVFMEIVVEGAGLPGSDEIQKADWAVVGSCKDQNSVDLLLNELDKGEAEAIVLAKEIGADLLLLDEKAGRRVAEKFDLECIGILGILLEAKSRQQIESVKPHLELLTKKARFFVHPTLFERILKMAGEG